MHFGLKIKFPKFLTFHFILRKIISRMHTQQKSSAYTFHNILFLQFLMAMVEQPFLAKGLPFDVQHPYSSAKRILPSFTELVKSSSETSDQVDLKHLFLF
jgi:hypothetical protein